MTIEEVLANLEGYSLWEYGSYKINKEEADCIISALKELKERREADESSK